MQLRPRDGTGRAVTANDGKLRSFTKILDQDESGDMDFSNVRGGDVYMMKESQNASVAGGKKLIKFEKYDPKKFIDKKIPKIKNVYAMVRSLVEKAADPTKLDFKTIDSIRKYYVDKTSSITDKEFGKILKEFDLLPNVEVDDNVTDHNDIKGFVDEAIETYKRMHPNRPLSLKDENYQKYINKVLKRVKQQYLPSMVQCGSDDSNKLKEKSIYSHWDQSTTGGRTATPLAIKAGATANADANKDWVAVDALNPKGIGNNDNNKEAMAAWELKRDIVTISITALDTLSSQNKTGENYDASPCKAFSLITVFDKDLADLKALIEDMYDQFIKRTKKEIKKNPYIELQFTDGGRKHRSGGARKPAHHSRHRDGARSAHKKRAAGRSRR